MNILLKIALVPVAAVVVFCAAAYTTGVYEGLTDTPERYLAAESGCMDERPDSDARADCMWEARRRYRDGYFQTMVDGRQSIAAAARAQQELDAAQSK